MPQQRLRGSRRHAGQLSRVVHSTVDVQKASVTLVALPALLYLFGSFALLATSYHSYFFSDDFDGIHPAFAIRLWLAGSLLVWLGATTLIIWALRRRRSSTLWLTPLVWLGATWLLHEVTTSWLPVWFG
jgi:hypothetical protein